MTTQTTNEKRIYFAGSIRGGRDDQSMYLAIISLLKQYGQVMTEHVGIEDVRSDGERMSDEQIYRRDIEWLADSDFLVAEVTMPSLGVGYEIASAIEWKKPVLCLFRPNTGRALSAMIAGNSGLAVREYGSITDLKEIIANFFCEP